MLALLTVGVVALVTKRFGLRAALALGGAAVGLHLLADQRRKRGGGSSSSSSSRGGGAFGGRSGFPDLASLPPTSAVFIRGADGRITRVTRQHLALMLREGDFTADDYETLLRLDEDIQPRPGGGDVAEKIIASLPSRVFAETGKSAACACCVICLSDFNLGDTVKTLPCGHEFHGPCLDSWLRVKSRCPICVAEL